MNNWIKSTLITLGLFIIGLCIFIIGNIFPIVGIFLFTPIVIFSVVSIIYNIKKDLDNGTI